MKIRNQKWIAIMTAGILGVSVLGGCAAKNSASKSNGTQTESGETQKEEDATQSKAPSSDTAQSKQESVGAFETKDVEGNAYTEKIFEDAELTMVNVFTTWCTPCVEELPELQKLSEEMADKGVKVVGIVMDTVDEDGSIYEEALEKAKMLKDSANITYPLLIPDSGYLNGRIEQLDSFPETFFVDKNGTIVGETYVGSRGLDDWRSVVEEELANLKGGN